ncbi:MAG: hypothetical protein AAGA80_16760 [Cyanobacteria bacterium P01_F01_bin.143]
MNKSTHTGYELANRLQSIPAEQIKQAVITFQKEDENVPESLQSIFIEEENPEQLSFSETASYEEWSKLFHEWVETHRGKNLPLLSDEAISRKSIYGDRF